MSIGNLFKSFGRKSNNYSDTEAKSAFNSIGLYDLLSKTNGTHKDVRMSNIQANVAWAYYMSIQPIRHAVEKIWAPLFSSVEYQVYDTVKEEFVPNDEVTPIDALKHLVNKRPNPNQSGETLKVVDSISFNVTGNVYKHITALNENSEPTEINYIPPQWVTLLPTSAYQIGAIEINEGLYRGTYNRVIQDDGSITYIDKFGHEIAIIKNFNPDENYLYGLSPMSSAIAELEQYAAATLQNTSFIKKGARPAGAIVMPEGMPLMDEDEKKSMIERFRSFYQGNENAGNILFIEGGKDFKELSTNNKDMDYVNMMDRVTQKAYSTYNIPMPLVDTGTMTNSNYKEAKFFLIDLSIIPFAQFYISEINRIMLRRYPKNKGRYILKVNESQIPAVRERNNEKAQESGALTYNEVRGLHNYEGIGKKGDVLYIPSSLKEIGTEPESFGMPSPKLNEVEKVTPEDIEEMEDDFSDVDTDPEELREKMLAYKNSDGTQRFSTEFVNNFIEKYKR